MPQPNVDNEAARRGKGSFVSLCPCDDESAEFTRELHKTTDAQKGIRLVVPRVPATKAQSLIGLVLLLGAFALDATGQTPSPSPIPSSAEVSQIKTYTTEIDRFSKGRKFRTFGVFYEKDKGTWRELKGKADHQLDESCDVWTRDGKVVLAFFGFTSESGDWYHFIKYYYRDDGTLAKIQARLNTFYGNVSVLRDRYYDASGKLIKSTRRYLDIQTHKPVKSANFHDEPIPMFSKASALPFHRLL
jgi:hypothetical protein